MHWFFFCAVSDTFNLEPNLAVGRGVCLFTSFLQIRCGILDPDALFCKIWLLVGQKMINERLYLRFFFFPVITEKIEGEESKSMEGNYPHSLTVRHL